MDKNSKTVIPQLIDNVTLLITNVIDLEIRMQAVTDLLIKRGAVTKDEFDEMCALIENRDFINMREDLLETVNKISRQYEENGSIYSDTVWTADRKEAYEFAKMINLCDGVDIVKVKRNIDDWFYINIEFEIQAREEICNIILANDFGGLNCLNGKDRIGEALGRMVKNK